MSATETRHTMKVGGGGFSLKRSIKFRDYKVKVGGRAKTLQTSGLCALIISPRNLLSVYRIA